MPVAGNGSSRLEEKPTRVFARRPGTPVPGGPEEVPTQRRWGLIAAGVMLTLACGLAFIGLWRSAGNREPVVVAARDVDRGETIERDDLRTALVAAESGVGTIPEGDLDDVVGRVALTDLARGSLLAPDEVADADDRLVANDEALVGARLGPGAAPLGELPSGTEIVVVIRPGPSGGDGAVREVPGWLAELGGRDPNSGAREASLVVPQESAGAVAAAAAEERIAIVALEG